jgi:bisphosphoglycerate-independent phosphoglycerate mutase (AlkP superfamily)
MNEIKLKELNSLLLEIYDKWPEQSAVEIIKARMERLENEEDHNYLTNG